MHMAVNGFFSSTRLPVCHPSHHHVPCRGRCKTPTRRRRQLAVLSKPRYCIHVEGEGLGSGLSLLLLLLNMPMYPGGCILQCPCTYISKWYACLSRRAVRLLLVLLFFISAISYSILTIYPPPPPLLPLLPLLLLLLLLLLPSPLFLLLLLLLLLLPLYHDDMQHVPIAMAASSRPETVFASSGHAALHGRRR